MEYKGLTLDKFQVDAIDSIDKNHSVVVSAPTGSGKTLIADYIIDKYIDRGITVIYTAPIKALSNQKYKEFSKDYGKERVGLITGDITINPHAPIVIMTTEIYRNMAIIRDPALKDVAYVIFDEIHFINDVERGYVWEESIMFSGDKVRLLCLSATIPNAREFADWIGAIKGHTVDTVINDVRPVPLHRKFYDDALGITTLDEIMKNRKNFKTRSRVLIIPKGKKAKNNYKSQYAGHVELVSLIKDKLPCFFFTFSRQKCQKNAIELSQSKLFRTDSEITAKVRQKLSDAPDEINSLRSTQDLKKVLPYGIAFHHAGLLPIIKELVEELFSEGLIKVLYTTETFAVGINMPAKTVCFDSMMKFDGMTFRYLNSKEYFQIAGRAGRRGIDTEGFAYAVIDSRDTNYALLKTITTDDTDPIRSQFRLSVNTVLNLVKQHNKAEIEHILCKNFNTYQKYGDRFDKEKTAVIYRNFNNIKKDLERLNYIKAENLTKKGTFSARIYSDEIATGEIFSTGFYKTLEDYKIFLILACLSYEDKPKNEFEQVYDSPGLRRTMEQIKADPYLKTVEKFNHMRELTALIHPCYGGATIFDIIDNTNLLEGDVIRIFRQIIDRIGQIRNATDDKKLMRTLDTIEKKIDTSMCDIDVI
ncbi:MAG: DEAD/DEAH box helicase [Nanohaloarchaea archaeon]|nr:DEAD/DEAH box helicase [Candidatus Nanohaloarchaea archaeon]